MLNDLHRELTSDASNDDVYGRLMDGPAQRVRQATLDRRKAEWMSALSTLESFFVVICARRFTIDQPAGGVCKPIPPVLLILFLWMVARGLIPHGGFEYTKIDGTKRHGKRDKDKPYCWGTLHQVLKAVYSWSHYHGVVAPQVSCADARPPVGLKAVVTLV